mgnify:CR=1 FL=1
MKVDKYVKMVLILDGNSEMGAHVFDLLFYLFDAFA